MRRSSFITAICFSFLTLFLCVAGASSERAAMVVETKGKNTVSFNGVEARMRTLQVLPQGAQVKVDAGATLRLSYFKSGTKETIVGPCEVKIQEEESLKLSGKGEVKAQSGRDSSTDLPGTENLRRTGGTLQGYRFDESPDQRLAMMDNPYTGSVVSSYSTKRNGEARFKGRQRVYLDAARASQVAWEGAPRVVNLRLLQGGEEVSSLEIQGTSAQIPAQLSPGKEYKLELVTAANVLAESTFSVLTAQEAERVSAAENLIRREESAHSRLLYVRLLRLQSELGLYSQAERTAEAALESFPDDPGFLFMAALLKVELGKNTQAETLLKRARDIEAELYR
jgi:hypothetical protein